MLTIVISICLLIIDSYGVMHDNYIEYTFQISRTTRLLSGMAKQERWNKNNSMYELFFKNSSSEIQSIILEMDGSSVTRVDRNSNLCTRECIIEIVRSSSASVFVCEGKANVERLCLLCGYSMGSIFEATERGETMLAGDSPSIAVKESCLRDIRMHSLDWGLTSGGGIRREEVIGCLFENVSRGMEQGEEKKERRRIRREESDIRDSFISRVERGIYGVIGVRGMELGEGNERRRSECISPYI